jgi:hypothetical protein
VPAWDVYLVFGPAAEWNERPPVPTYWMHQLSRGAAPADLWLDGEKLRRVVNNLLSVAGSP